MVALELNVLSGPADPQFAVWTELLGPVARYASADGKDAQALLREQKVGEMVQIEERVKMQLRLAFASAHPVGKRHVQTQLRVGERRHEDGHVLLKRRLQNTPALGMPLQMLADGSVQLP